jgi:hypothetical protein
MFSFKDPKPAVAPHQRIADLPFDAAAPELGLPMAASALAAPALAPVPFALHFLVRYTLAEYTGFMWQHAGFLIRRRRVGPINSAYLRLKSTLMAAVHFILLRRGSRTYEMTIDFHGIVRVSDSGVTLIAWRDVRAIRRYQNGFLMILARGTLPIPYRCLNQDDIAGMRGFARALRRPDA